VAHFSAFVLAKPGYAHQRVAKETSKHGVSINPAHEILQRFSRFFFERGAERLRRILERFQSD
jgi:hypothetical protein